MPRTFEAWAAHLRHTPADAVFILGDLFEVWVGDDARSAASSGAASRCWPRRPAGAMSPSWSATATSCVGAAMLRGLRPAWPCPTRRLLDAWGQRVLLTHGDALCLDDTELPGLSRRGRAAPAWQRDFLARPLAERLQQRPAARAESEAQAATATGFDPRPLGRRRRRTPRWRWMHAPGGDRAGARPHPPAGQRGAGAGLHGAMC